MSINNKEGSASENLESIKNHYSMTLKINGAGHYEGIMREAIGKAYELGLTAKIVSLQEENKYLKKQLEDE